MKSSVEILEDNKVKVTVEVDGAEFEREVDAAFRRIAKEVRLPGFRPGKAPRRILEARLGPAVGRQEALRESLPGYYTRAVIEHDVDVIAPPEIEITEGQESGDVAFDAVVQVRPRVTVGGYQGLRVEIPRPTPTDAEVEEYLDRLRSQFGELETVERPAVDGDHVSIDIEGSLRGEPIGGLTAQDYLYEVGSGAVVPEIDDNLRGATAGDILSFEAEHPDPDEEDRLQFRVLVKEVKQKVLPPLDDDFARQASELESLAELQADVARRLGELRRSQASFALRSRAQVALAELVTEDVPEALVGSEMQARLEDLAARLRQQGVELEQYLAASGRSPEEITAELRDAATEAVKTDLALRAVAEAEELAVTDEEVDAELARFAEQVGQDLDTVRTRFRDSGQLSQLRSSLQKAKALEWLVDNVEVVDEEGEPVDRSALEAPDDGEEPEASEEQPEEPGASDEAREREGDTE